MVANSDNTLEEGPATAERGVDRFRRRVGRRADSGIGVLLGCLFISNLGEWRGGGLAIKRRTPSKRSVPKMARYPLKLASVRVTWLRASRC